MTWKSIQINNCGVGFKLISEDGTHGIGSILVADSVFNKVETGVMTFPPTKDTSKGSTGVSLDNVKFSGVKNIVADNANVVHLAGSKSSVNTVRSQAPPSGLRFCTCIHVLTKQFI